MRRYGLATDRTPSKARHVDVLAPTSAEDQATTGISRQIVGNHPAQQLALLYTARPELLLSLQRSIGNGATAQFVRELQRASGPTNRQHLVQRQLTPLDATLGGSKATTNWGQIATKTNEYNQAVTGGKSLLRQTELLREVKQLLNAGKALDTGFRGFRHRGSRKLKRQAAQALLGEVAHEENRIAADRRALKETFDEAGDEIWRQYIDLKQQHFGSAVFDKGLHGKNPEKGYVRGMADAHKLARGHLGERITVGMYEQLHNAAYSHGKDEDQGWSAETDSVKLAKGQASAEFIGSLHQQSVEALSKELNDRGVPYGDTISMVYERQDQIELKLGFQGKNQATVKAKLQRILDTFYEEVEVSDNPLAAISKLHKQLEYLHPFKDANTRTNLVILNKVLVENGFRPTILDEPNQSYLQSTEEWAGLIAKGINRWTTLREAQKKGDPIPQALQDFDADEGTDDRSKLKDDASTKKNLKVKFDD